MKQEVEWKFIFYLASLYLHCDTSIILTYKSSAEMRKNMKKLTKILSMVLIAAIISSGVVYKQTEAASDISFGGSYLKVVKYDGYSEYYSVNLSQYSSTKGNKKGEFTLSQYSDYRENCTVVGKLTKVKKNTYRYKTKKVTITFKVYKKKLVIKQKGTSMSINSDFSGTYKKENKWFIKLNDTN